MHLLFATHNRHKVDELRAALPPDFTVISLSEASLHDPIPEPHDTLEENAREKALRIFHQTSIACFSEDTGLEVDALNGEPGVRSARYAGEEAASTDNVTKLLRQMEGITNRQARFRTVICLVQEGQVDFFEGVCEGRVLLAPQGEGGFGYDPVFVPDGADRSFAEMDLAEKNRFSHRRKAVDKLVSFLNQSAQNE